ncbi:MAG: hypothetical protein WAM85_14235 [Terracidiphilus sp.]
MKAAFTVLNASFLFLTTAMYLGTGWSMWLFQFPVAPHLTTESYFWVFVPQVASATTFFTWMTSLMMLSAIIMLWLEWKGGIRWVPIVVLLSVLVATGLTVWLIFPYNNAMSAGIHDQTQLQSILAHWIDLNRVRVLLWTVQWASMMYYFGRRAYDAIRPAGT